MSRGLPVATGNATEAKLYSGRQPACATAPLRHCATAVPWRRGAERLTFTT